MGIQFYGATIMITAYKNLKSGKYFLLLDEANDRFRLLNPEGIVVTLPSNLFLEEPATWKDAEAAAHLSEVQIQTWQRMQAEMNAKIEAERRLKNLEKEKASKRVGVPDRKEPAPPRTRVSRSTPPDKRKGVAASWNATTLVFYRPQIDRLGPNQSFRVIVDGVGEYVMTKNDFAAVFSEVILSPKFKAEGFYAYDPIPDKAKKFLQGG